MSNDSKNSRVVGRTFHVGLVGAVALLTACSGASPNGSEQGIETSSMALLTTACTYDASSNVTLRILDGEVGYIAKKSPCASEPCVVINAVDALNGVCTINSTGKSITITGQGAANKQEKLIIDYTNGVFAKNTAGTSLIVSTLDTTVGVPAKNSKVDIIAPAAGSQMALGVSGLDADTTAARVGGPRLDVSIKWSTATTPGDVSFQGGAGPDVFTADVTGWTTMPALPAAWDTAAKISPVIGAVYAGTLTVSGGAGDDILAGGAGANTLSGGTGNDTFLQSANSHAETMHGDDGIDTVDYSSRAASVFVTLGNTANDGVLLETDNVRADVEIVKGGSGNDTLDATGVTTDVVLIGQAGNDTLIGGTGDDDLCGGPGNDRLKWSGFTVAGDNLVGGTGQDTADYSTAAAGVVACLDPADATCVAQNGPGAQIDVINGALAAVCPRASLTINVVPATPTLTVVPVGMRGAAMAVDVENVTGHPSLANTLHCGSLACTVVGGSADDTIKGSAGTDAIFGGGAAIGDTVATNGGSDLVDLTHATGGALTDVVNCHLNTDAVVVLMDTIDNPFTATTCGAAVTITP